MKALFTVAYVQKYFLHFIFMIIVRNALDVFNICNADAFPNVHKMLCAM